MAPSGLGAAAGGTIGRSVSPNLVEDVIINGTFEDVIVDGVARRIFSSGTVTVVTEELGKIG